MRILLTVPALRPEYGGPAIKVAQLAVALREQEADVIVAGCGDVRDRTEGTVVLPVLAGFHGTPVPATTNPVRRLAAGADVVHVLGYRDPVGTSAARAARRLGIPFVFEPAGMHRRRLRSLRIKAG